MLYHHILERAVNGEVFKKDFRAIKAVYADKDITTSIFILNNARIHYYKGLCITPEITNFNIKYFSPYLLFLNLIGNVFLV